jgi:hypothetical protein
MICSLARGQFKNLKPSPCSSLVAGDRTFGLQATCFASSRSEPRGTAPGLPGNLGAVRFHVKNQLQHQTGLGSGQGNAREQMRDRSFTLRRCGSDSAAFRREESVRSGTPVRSLIFPSAARCPAGPLGPRPRAGRKVLLPCLAGTPLPTVADGMLYRRRFSIRGALFASAIASSPKSRPAARLFEAPPAHE